MTSPDKEGCQTVSWTRAEVHGCNDTNGEKFSRANGHESCRDLASSSGSHWIMMMSFNLYWQIGNLHCLDSCQRINGLPHGHQKQQRNIWSLLHIRGWSSRLWRRYHDRPHPSSHVSLSQLWPTHNLEWCSMWDVCWKLWRRDGHWTAARCQNNNQKNVSWSSKPPCSAMEWVAKFFHWGIGCKAVEVEPMSMNKHPESWCKSTMNSRHSNADELFQLYYEQC